MTTDSTVFIVNKETREIKLHKINDSGAIEGKYTEMTTENELQQVKEALELSLKTFRQYEALHNFKGTEDSYAKAKRNAKIAISMELALESLNKYTERLKSEEFEEELGVAIAEAYVMIPKGSCWEDATDSLTKAAISTIIGNKT